MELLPACRLAIFCLTILFSIVELGLCAKDILVTKGGVFIDNGLEVLMLSPFFFPFAAFGLAVAVITLLFMVPILIIDATRKASITSVIAFELIWTGIFWVLWLAVAGNATAARVFNSCTFEDERVNTICHQFPALQGLAFFNWLLLFSWFVTLVVVAINLRRKASNASLWRQSVVSARMSIAQEAPTGGPSFKFWRRKSTNDAAAVRMDRFNATPREVGEVKSSPVYDQYSSNNSGV